MPHIYILDVATNYIIPILSINLNFQKQKCIMLTFLFWKLNKNAIKHKMLLILRYIMTTILKNHLSNLQFM